MTALLSARSAWLLVGSTPACLANVHSAGQAFRSLRHPAAVAVARTFRGVAADNGLVFALQPADGEFEGTAIAGVFEELRGREDAIAQLKASFAKLFLCGEPLGVGHAGMPIRLAYGVRTHRLKPGRRLLRQADANGARCSPR
jgi:hypothetical protein